VVPREDFGVCCGETVGPYKDAFCGGIVFEEVVNFSLYGGFEKEDCEDGVGIQCLAVDDVLDDRACLGVMAGEEPDSTGGLVGPAGRGDVLVGGGILLADVVVRQVGREVWDGGVEFRVDLEHCDRCLDDGGVEDSGAGVLG
jgi:hypothetical protein